MLNTLRKTDVVPGRLLLYTVFHLNLAYSSIEEEQRAEVIERCYWPLLRVARDYSLPLGIEATGYTLESIAAIDPLWVNELRALTVGGACEFVGSGYAQIIGPLVPGEVNAANLRLGHKVYERLLGIRPDIALINEQAYSAGLVQHYLDAGYKAIIMEWDNPARFHPEWTKEWRYYPQYACGLHGEKIELIWNMSIAFQKFQRYAHGDIELDEFMKYLAGHSDVIQRAVPIYGNDVEIFDFRPGRYKTEATLHQEGEWSRIEKLFQTLSSNKNFSFIPPGEVMVLKNLPYAGNDLHLESAECPVPVKKQDKYNITRWAVTGRDDLRINTACHRIYSALVKKGDTSETNWRELCYLWSSDFRTHITERRWQSYLDRLMSFVEKTGCLCFQEMEDGRKDKGEARGQRLSVVREGRFLRIDSGGRSLVLDCARGLAIRELRFGNEGTIPQIITIPHGYFDNISLGADWYSGHFIHEGPGQHKITDLSGTEPDIDEEKGSLLVHCRIDTPLGQLEKSLFLSPDSPWLTCRYRMNWETAPIGSVRLGHMTLNPEAFERSSLFYRTCNGSSAAETFSLNGHEVRHGAAVSFMVSAEGGFGMTEGWIEIGDRNNRLRIETDSALMSVIGLITYMELDTGYFCRVSFSMGEMDETSRSRYSLSDCAAFTLRIGIV